MDLANLAMDSATTTAKFMGEECKVTYRPTILTTKNLESAASESMQDENTDKFLQLLSDILISWDLTNNGEEVPTDLDGVKSVPLAFVRIVYTAVMEDAGRGEAPTPSKGGSPRRAISATVPTGTQSFEPHDT